MVNPIPDIEYVIGRAMGGDAMGGDAKGGGAKGKP
jgi:hypothetical protein